MNADDQPIGLDVLISYFAKINDSIVVFNHLKTPFDEEYKSLFKNSIVIATISEMLMLQGERLIEKFTKDFLFPKYEGSLEDVDDVSDTMLDLGTALAKRAWRFQARAMEMYLNGWYQVQIRKDSDAFDIERKRQIVYEFNTMIREIDAALKGHPASKSGGQRTKQLYDDKQPYDEACVLVVMASKDGAGRYALQNRISRQRIGFHNSLLEYMPFQLVPDVPRKEHVLNDWASKKGEVVRTRKPKRDTESKGNPDESEPKKRDS